MNPFLLIDSPDKPIARMDVAPAVSANVRELFLDGAKHFEEDIDENVDFDPGYQLQEGECFQIKDFPIDQNLLAVCRQPLSADRLEPDDLTTLRIKSIVGYDFSNRQQRLYFQNFDSRRVLIPGKRFALFSTADSSTFQQLKRPVVLLDAQIAAIWDNGTLKFKKFQLAKQIFDLSEYFTAATDEQIGTFVSHKLIACDDPPKLIKACNAWSRKKIALIMRGGVLDCKTAEMVRQAGVEVDYQLPMRGDQIIMPTDKHELRALLQFLDEDIYRGPISQRRLLSSGKRELK